MKKLKIFLFFSFFTILYFLPRPNSTYANCFCSVSNPSSCTIGGSCTACVPNATCEAGGQGTWGCETGSGVDNGSGGCHCNTSGCGGGTTNTDPTGSHDAQGPFATPAEVHTQAFCTQGGWATDPDDRGQDIFVQLLNNSNGAVIRSAFLASNARSDLGGVCNSSTCAWDVNVWTNISKNTPYQFRAQARDLTDASKWVNLPNTNRWMMCVDLSCTMTGPVNVCPNQPNTFSVTGTGTGITDRAINYTVTSSQLWRSPAPYQQPANGSLSISLPAGSHYVVCNAFGPNASKCTGNPFGIASGWVDCGGSDALTVTAANSNCALPIVNLVSPANSASLASGTTSTALSASVQFRTYNNVRSRAIYTRDVTAGAAFAQLCTFSADTGDLTFNCTKSGLINGHSYQWYATATNEGGTTTSSTWSFSVAAPTPATCTLSLAPNPMTLVMGGTGTMTATVTVSGSAGTTINQVTFATNIGGSASASPGTDTLAPYQTTISTISTGSSTVQANAFLASGNNCSGTATVQVNAAPTVPPTITPTRTPTPTLPPVPPPALSCPAGTTEVLRFTNAVSAGGPANSTPYTLSQPISSLIARVIQMEGHPDQSCTTGADGGRFPCDQNQTFEIAIGRNNGVEMGRFVDHSPLDDQWMGANGPYPTNPAYSWNVTNSVVGSNTWSMTHAGGGTGLQSVDYVGVLCAQYCTPTQGTVTCTPNLSTSTNTLNLSWATSTTAGGSCGQSLTYQVSMLTTPSAGCTGSISGTSCTLTGLTDQTYSWNVREFIGSTPADTSNTCTFTVNSSRNWFRVLGGGVHSNGLIGSLTAGHAIKSSVSDEAKALNLKFLDVAPSGRSDAGILTFNAGDVDLGPAPTAAIAPSRVAPGTTFDGDKFNYDSISSRATNSINITSTLVNDATSPGIITSAEFNTLATGAYLIIGNVKLDGAYAVASGRKISFLVSGDLTLGDNGTPGTPTQITLPAIQDGLSGLLFIVKGDITIAPETSRLEGVYISDGGVSTGTAGSNADSQLAVVGTLISYSTMNLQRDLPAAQNSTPGELFTYRPDILLSVPRDWVSNSVRWKGTSP